MPNNNAGNGLNNLFGNIDLSEIMNMLNNVDVNQMASLLSNLGLNPNGNMSNRNVPNRNMANYDSPNYNNSNYDNPNPHPNPGTRRGKNKRNRLEDPPVSRPTVDPIVENNMRKYGDRRTELLNAMKPMVTPERAEILDKIMQLYILSKIIRG